MSPIARTQAGSPPRTASQCRASRSKRAFNRTASRSMASRVVAAVTWTRTGWPFMITFAWRLSGVLPLGRHARSAEPAPRPAAQMCNPEPRDLLASVVRRRSRDVVSDGYPHCRVRRGAFYPCDRLWHRSGRVERVEKSRSVSAYGPLPACGAPRPIQRRKSAGPGASISSGESGSWRMRPWSWTPGPRRRR